MNFVILVLFSLIFSMGAIHILSSENVSAATYFPPLKQISDGVPLENVTCAEEFTLVLKSSTGYPVCLKPSSVDKLILRGWAIEKTFVSSTIETILTVEEAQSIAEEAYIFGYPLVLIDLTKMKTINVSEAMEKKAPINQFGHFTEFPTPDFTDVVKPNADTLYSVAYLDLSKEPIVLHVPDTDDRYYLMPMMDAYSNVFESPGKRTTGTGENNFAIVSPSWNDTLPKGLIKIQSPTDDMWIIGRIQTNGISDINAVNEIQKQFTLTPLSYFGKSYQPPRDVPVDSTIDMKTPPVSKIEQIDVNTFFNMMAMLMKTNPAAPEDMLTVEKFTKIGLIPGQEFDLQRFDPKTIAAIESGSKNGLAKIKSNVANLGTDENGWQKTLDLGSYGINYLDRASVAFMGLGANLSEDAIYPMAYVDSERNQLNGDNKYVLHFPDGQTPPVNAFWSLTLYGPELFFVENSIERYAIGDRDELQYNEDGSLDIYIQHEIPAGLGSNWLPAPEGDFNLILRMYWPTEKISDGSWQIPPLEKIE